MLTRREALLQCVALGFVKLAVPVHAESEALSAFADAEQATARRATPWNEIGPF